MELYMLPVFFAFFGYIFTTKRFILFLNSLTPATGLLVYYMIIFSTITILQYFGLVIGKKRMVSVEQTVGEIFIFFSFFVLVNFQSQYIQWIVDQNKKAMGKNISNSDDIDDIDNKDSKCTVIYQQAEDGMTYYLIRKYLHVSPEIARYLTFMVVPFIFCSIGLMLITNKVEMSVY